MEDSTVTAELKLLESFGCRSNNFISSAEDTLIMSVEVF